MIERLHIWGARIRARLHTTGLFLRTAWVAYPRRIMAGGAIVLLLLIGLGTIGVLTSPPKSFPANTLLVLPDEGGTPAIARALVEARIIRSARTFEIAARLTGVDTQLQSGTYVFQSPENALRVLNRVAAGETGVEPVRVTLTEGMTVREMADTFSDVLPGFDRAAFLEAASTSEGFLFPETYYFMPATPVEDIVVRLRAQFSLEISTIASQILASRRTMEEIVTMASLLEREAQTLEDKRIIAGILWRRIELDMPLQVDATFAYILGVRSHHPSFTDLEIDSPYNTYLNRGLPPTPIANPSFNAILAAITPIESDYLFYLTGVDGQMYYAADFEGHRENRRLFLDIE